MFISDSLTIRPYHPSDLPRLTHICISTAHPSLSRSLLPHLPSLYSTPYHHLSPDHIQILHHPHHGAVGYILGHPSTAQFITSLPSVLSTLPRESPPEEQGWFWDLVREPWGTVPGETMEEKRQFLERWPAHLHINILDSYRGQGWGRELMERWLEMVKGEGVTGVHLGVGRANEDGRRFYEAMGWREWGGDEGTAWMVKELGSAGKE